MTNAKIIKALQCASHFALYQDCYEKNCYANSGKGLYCNIQKLMADAADALEAAEKRIDELVTKCRQLESLLPKEGEWIHGRELGKEWLYDHWVAYFEDWHCSNCGVVFEQESKPKHRYCPNCGARMMKGEQE